MVAPPKCQLLKQTLWSDNLTHHEVLMPTNFLTRYNHYQISNIAHLMFVMGHELFRKSPSLSIFWDNFVPVHGNVDCLLHFVGYDTADECTSGIFPRWVVDQVPPGDGRHVGKFLDGHALQVVDGCGSDRTAIIIVIVIIRVFVVIGVVGVDFVKRWLLVNVCIDGEGP